MTMDCISTSILLVLLWKCSSYSCLVASLFLLYKSTLSLSYTRKLVQISVFIFVISYSYFKYLIFFSLSSVNVHGTMFVIHFTVSFK